MITEDEESLCHQKTPLWRCKNPKLDGGVYCRKHAKKRKKKARRGPIRRKTEDEEETIKCDDDEDLTDGEVKKRGRTKADFDQEVGEEKEKDDSTEGGEWTCRRMPQGALDSKPPTTLASETPPEVVEERVNKHDRKYLEEVSLNCHQCQRNDEGRVIRWTKYRTKRFCVPCRLILLMILSWWLF